MSDITGAPAAGADAGPSLGLPSFTETASERLTSLKGDPEWGARYLKGDAGARNEMKTLLSLTQGNLSEADQATLAASIKLERVPSLAAGERQREATAAAADARVPQYSFKDRGDFGAGLSNVTTELSAWTTEIGLPPSTAKLVTQAVIDSGVRNMDQQTYATWKSKQDFMLLGAAHGDQAVVDGWRAAATKILARGKFNFENSAALHSAFAIRALANVGAQK